MRITKLSLKNFKGRTREIELGPINVVHGPNWSGKTAILSALRVGLLGYEPKLGKRPSDTFGLATGDQMHVILDSSDANVAIKRAWKMERGSVKATVAESGASWPKVPSMLLDVRDYFGMTAQGRRDHVLSMLDLKDAGLSDDAIFAKIKTTVVDGHNAEAESEVGEIAEEFEYWCGDRDAHETPLSEWMAGNVQRLTNRIAGHILEAKQAAAVLQTIAQEKAAHPQGTPQDQQGLIGKLQTELDALAQQYGARTAAAGRWVQRQQLERQLAGMTDMTSELARLKGELEDAKKQAEACASSEQARYTIKAAQSRLDSARALHSQVTSQYNALEEQFIKDNKFDKCPTCGSEEHVPAMKKKLKKSFEAARKPLLEDLGARAKVIADMEVELDKMAKNATASTFDADVTVSEKMRNRVRLAETAFAHVERQVNAREKLVAQLSGFADVSSPEDLSPIAERMTAIRGEIEQCRKKQGARTLLLEREAQGAEAEKQKSSAEIRTSVVKAVLKSIQELQQSAIDGAFGPFLATVRKFTDGVLDFDLEYRDGEIGYVKSGTWVSHQTFSGSETALTYAGLGVALAQRSPIKIVMLDEVLLTPETKAKMVRRVAELMADGTIDQFVIVDVTKEGWQGPGITCIEAR